MPSDQVQNLGVIFDSTMDLEHLLVNIKCNPGFYNLWSVSRVRKYFTIMPGKTIIQAFVTSKLA